MRETWRQLHADEASREAQAPELGFDQSPESPSITSVAEERKPSGDGLTSDFHLKDEKGLRSDRFWQAYAADRYGMLTGSSSPKYLIFEPLAGLGNRISGMMGAFLLSVAFDRVFLHKWDAGDRECAAGYEDLFVPPFEPWFSSSLAGGLMSGPDGLLGKQGSSRPMETWLGDKAISAPDEKRHCSLDLTQAGVSNGGLDKVFVDRRGEDPKANCRVLFVKTNQYLVEFLSSPAYGAPTVGGVKLFEWLSGGMAVDILFSGLFRPLPVVRQRVELTSGHVYPATRDRSKLHKTVAAHARAWQLRKPVARYKFVKCLERWVRSSNASTVVLATDMQGFVKDTKKELRSKGIAVMAMEGVHRIGESPSMRDSVEKIQAALAEMLLVGKADIVITSPKSSFSALAAAQGGMSSHRVGGTSCTEISNKPEFHLLECGMKWTVELAKWSSVYPFAEAIRQRCAN